LRGWQGGALYSKLAQPVNRQHYRGATGIARQKDEKTIKAIQEDLQAPDSEPKSAYKLSDKGW